MFVQHFVASLVLQAVTHGIAQRQGNGKAVRNAPRGEVLGSELDGVAGTVGAPTARIVALVALTLRVCRAGRAVYARLGRQAFQARVCKLCRPGSAGSARLGLRLRAGRCCGSMLNRQRNVEVLASRHDYAGT